MTRARLDLTGANEDVTLIPSEHGMYGYTRVGPRDSRYGEARTLLLGETVRRGQITRDLVGALSERAGLEPQAVVEELIVKSRQRVKIHGEVFTPRHMVGRMLDLVREELETGPDFVDKTFLEPAAGDGNFLVAILGHKLRAIANRYPAEEWLHESLFALASIYGIELLEDNHQDAKAIMLAEFLSFHQDHGTVCGPDTDLYRAAKFLIDVNIVRGNTLTGQTPEAQDIQFSWWNRIEGAPGMVQREPFTLVSLRDNGAFDFTIYDSYQVCRIDKVHEEVRADA